jgi:hypothetical protein
MNSFKIIGFASPICLKIFHYKWWFDLIWFLVFNGTFSNISAISWRPVLVVEEAGENHRPWCKQLVNFITCVCESSHGVHPFCNIQSRISDRLVWVASLSNYLTHWATRDELGSCRGPGWLNELGSCRGPGWLNELGSCRGLGWLNELGSCRGPGWLNELGSCRGPGWLNGHPVPRDQKS